MTTCEHEFTAPVDDNHGQTHLVCEDCDAEVEFEIDAEQILQGRHDRQEAAFNHRYPR